MPFVYRCISLRDVYVIDKQYGINIVNVYQNVGMCNSMNIILCYTFYVV